MPYQKSMLSPPQSVGAVVELSHKPTTTVNTRKCQYCSRTFSKAEHLSRHERSHTKEKPFHCSFCGNFYRRHDTLLRHLRSHGFAKTRRNVVSRGLEANFDHLGFTMNTSSSSPLDLALLQHQMNHSAVNGTQRLPLPESNSLMQTKAVEINSASGSSPSSGSAHFGPNFLSPNNPDQFPMLQNEATGGIDPNLLSPISPDDMWMDSLMSSNPNWLNSYDFDLDALNNCVVTSLDSAEPLFQSYLPSLAPSSDVEMDSERQIEYQSRHRQVNDKIRLGWYTNIPDFPISEETTHGSGTGHATPVAGGSQYDVGDDFCRKVSQKLKPKTHDDPPPSATFLNLSVRIYFTKFNPIFPVIHSQTFQPSPKNSLLVLSICSVGSQLIGTKGATAQGVRIFERLNKAVLATWDNSFNFPILETATMIQASLIGQTFALISGDPKHLLIADGFHGGMIAWARNFKILKYRSPLPQVANLSGRDLQNAWKSWARSEEVLRTVLALHIHDALLVNIFNHEPLMPYDSESPYLVADDDLFDAPDAHTWRDLLLKKQREESSPQNSKTENNQSHFPIFKSRFTSILLLHNIAAKISKRQRRSSKSSEPFTTTSVKFTKSLSALLSWRSTYRCSFSSSSSSSSSPSSSSETNDPFSPLLLYHATFLHLLCNIETLERAIGRDGPASDADLQYAISWAESESAERCLAHVRELLKVLGKLRLGQELPFWGPHALFVGAVVGYGFKRFRARGQAEDESCVVRKWPEFCDDINIGNESGITGVEIGSGGDAASTSAATSTSSTLSVAPQDTLETGMSRSSTQQQQQQQQQQSQEPTVDEMLYTLMDTLQRMGHWGIAKKLAGTVRGLICAEGNEEWMV